MPEVWGPDAAEFKPSRWFNEDDGLLRQPSPFGTAAPFFELAISRGRKRKSLTRGHFC
jgi:hypothetical protein